MCFECHCKIVETRAKARDYISEAEFGENEV
jgi:hypothetical protein